MVDGLWHLWLPYRKNYQGISPQNHQLPSGDVLNFTNNNGNMGGVPGMGVPQSWLAYKGKSRTKMADDWGCMEFQWDFLGFNGVNLLEFIQDFMFLLMGY